MYRASGQVHSSILRAKLEIIKFKGSQFYKGRSFASSAGRRVFRETREVEIFRAGERVSRSSVQDPDFRIVQCTKSGAMAECAGDRVSAVPSPNNPVLECRAPRRGPHQRPAAAAGAELRCTRAGPRPAPAAALAGAGTSSTSGQQPAAERQKT